MEQGDSEQAAAQQTVQQAVQTQLDDKGIQQGSQVDAVKAKDTAVEAKDTTVKAMAEAGDSSLQQSLQGLAKDSAASTSQKTAILEQPKFQVEIGFDPDIYPNFLDISSEAAAQAIPKHKSSIDLCASYVWTGNASEHQGDKSFDHYDDEEDIDDDGDEEDWGDSEELEEEWVKAKLKLKEPEDDLVEREELEDNATAQSNEQSPLAHWTRVYNQAGNYKDYNHRYLNEFDMQQYTPWVYPGAQWVAKQTELKHISIRDAVYKRFVTRTHTYDSIKEQLEYYYADIRKGKRLRVEEKRIMLKLLEERNRLLMPSGGRQSSAILNLKRFSKQELEALEVLKKKLRSLVYYAKERKIDYDSSAINEHALIWFYIKDANKLNQLRSLNGSGLSFVQDNQGRKNIKPGYSWYVNVRPNSFAELISNLRRFGFISSR